MAGINQQTRQLTTDGTGQVGFAYAGSPLPFGSDQVQATALVNGVAAYSNVVTVPWNNGVNQAPVVSAGSPQTITLPAAAVLNGSVTDDGLPNNTLSIAWSLQSGPAAVTFDNPNQAATAASFTTPGTYVLLLTASDGVLSASSTVTIAVNANPNWSSGWLLNPLNDGSVSGPVPVTLIAGITLTSGTLSYYPANRPDLAVTLLSPTTGSGQIGVFDTTLLNNGAYFLVLNATNSQGQTQISQVLVTAVGDYKPGRVTATITDLTVPAPGLPIQIQHTYDSLVRGTSSDFGNGWRLGVNIQTTISPAGDVTLTLNGRSRTFYFTPPPNSVFTAYYTPQYTAEPGLFGSLVNTGDNCNGVLIKVGNIWECAINNAGSVYQAAGYQYRDPYGRMYTLGPDGTLQAVKDLNGNTLTITAAGISNTNGLSVPFVRDSAGRITKITDTLGNVYQYAYDAAGNLASVTYPGIATPAQYQYDATHLLTQETDRRGNIAGTTTYYPDGKLKSVTDAVSNTTQYVYDTAAHKTTITNPDSGTVVTVADAYGMPLTVTDPLARITTNTYDANHNLLTSTDPLGKTTTYTYDVNGFRTSLKDPLGNLWGAAYNQVGGPTAITNPLNQTQNVTYDSNFNVSTITDSLGSVAGFTYNAQALPLTLKDARGNTSSYTYDQYGNRTGYTDPINRTTNSVYDTHGNLSSQTDPRGNKTQYAYDALNRKTSMTDAAGNVTKYAYDANNNKISDTDALNRVTSYTYDVANRLTQTTYPDGTTKSWTYDFRDNKLTATDQLGRVTKWVYDLAGQLTTMTYAFGTADAATNKYSYDGDGHKLTQTDPRGNTTSYTYDAGRMISTTDVVGNVTQFTYDRKGQRISTTDAKNRVTTFTYDARGRQLTATAPDGTTVSKSYDGLGSVLSSTDEEGRTASYGYDAASQLVSVTDALSNVTHYGYDLSGNKTNQTDANGHTTTYVYDALNQRTSRTLPLAQTESFTYDGVGNRVTRTDFNGKTTTYGYDSLNRLLSRTPDASFNAHPVSFTYTPTGRRATMTDLSGTTTYAYTNRDQVASKITSQGTLTYKYDALGNVTSVISSNSNGTTVSYAWDAANRLSSVTDNVLGAITTYNYDATNQPVSLAIPNLISFGYGYDNRDQLLTLGLNANSGAVAAYTQAFSASGRRLSAAEANGRSSNYNYDAIYRLSNEMISGDPTLTNNGVLSYGFDPVGNRLSLTSTLSAIAPQTRTYDAGDRISGETTDANGNLLTSGARSYSYDFEDRLTSGSNSSNGRSVSLIYDGDGQLVGRTEGGTTTRYLVDDLGPTGYPQIVEEAALGSVIRMHMYSRLREYTRQMVNGNWVVSYYGYDGGGNVRELINPNGVVTDTYTYDAYGNVAAQSGSTVNSFLYQGELYDSALGLYYLRARWYRPDIGRFLTADTFEGIPTRPGSLHRYAYGEQDPVNNSDPTGLTSDSIALTAEREVIDVETLAVRLVVAAATVCVLTRAWSVLDNANILSGGQSSIPKAFLPECQEPLPKCKDSIYSQSPTCEELEKRGFDFGSAAAAAKSEGGKEVNKKDAEQCDNGGGTHYRIRVGDGKLIMSILCCPCCEDRAGSAQLLLKCKVVP